MKLAESLEDIKNNMTALYRDLRDGEVEIKTASELANITGKFLKAEQLKLAREIFESSMVIGRVTQLEASE